jgi:hypothetical protein
LRLQLRSLAGRARRLKTRSRPRGSMKAGRNKPEGKPSMNREMCASLRPKGPVRKVPTSYDCSAESLGFNGGQHTHGGRTQPTRGRSSSHHDVTCNFADSSADDLANALTGTGSRRLVMPLGFGRVLRACRGVRRPGLLRTRTAGSDSGKATTSSRVMRRGPFRHHHQPARLPNRLRPSTYPSSCRAATRGTFFATLSTGVTRVRRWQGRALLQAVRRHHG